MAELREVFEMTTKQVEPDLDSWRDQERRQGRNRQRRRFGALAVAAAIGVAAIVLILVTRPGETASTPGDGGGAAVYPIDQSAVTVATDFLEAYGSFDAEAAIGYLADGANVSVVGGADGVGGALDEWPLNLSWWEAIGYEQTLDSCEVTGTSATGTSLHCTLDYQSFGSEKIDRGPFTGSYWDFTVRDGLIVWGSQWCETTEFSPQMWEPFAKWVTQNFPEDAKVMYANGHDDYRLTQTSIRLWEQHTKDYVKAVQQGTAA
jgi:hypothetical protein